MTHTRRSLLRTAVLAPLAALAVSLPLAGCGGGVDATNSGVVRPTPTPTPTPAPTPTARLRVVHASPDAPNVDVLVDNTVVLTNVPYRATSNYLTVPSGTRNIKVNATGTSTTVIDANVPLTANSDTTVLATGRLAGIQPLVLTDDNSAPTSGNIKVRLVHAAPGASNVDIYVTAPGADLADEVPTLTNVPFRAASGYLGVPAGTYQVRITPTGTKTVAIDSGALSLSAGQIRTGVAVGDPGVGQDLGAIILADN